MPSQVGLLPSSRLLLIQPPWLDTQARSRASFSLRLSVCGHCGGGPAQKGHTQLC
jgi:hypothetical protein